MKRLPTTHPKPTPRGGTTLTEVLMSMLCMGVGVVAVASLFPIALLRSVQATQLTHSTILRFNAETLIDLLNEAPRHLILNPDFDMGDPGNGIPPDGDDPVEYSEHFGRNYLIDPLGAMIVRGDEGRTMRATDNVGLMQRFDAMRIFNQTSAGPWNYTEKDAEQIVTLPDSWITLDDVAEFPVSSNQTEVTLEENLPDSVTGAPAANQTLRVVLFSETGDLSEARPLTSSTQLTAPDTIAWTRPLPDNGQYFVDNSGTITGKVSRVRVELRERRYTWMLSVRNVTNDVAVPQALVDVVISFRRSPSAADETPFVLSGAGRTYTVGPLANSDWDNVYDNSSNPFPDVPYPSTYPEPFLKKGGYMLDTTTGTWHRLANVDDNSNTITLERNVTSNLTNHHVVFMPGVVDVYPLGTKP